MMIRRTIVTLLLTFLALYAPSPRPIFAIDSDKPSTRGATVVGIRNEHPDFMVRIHVDRPDRTYKPGETMTVFARSARPGYVYLLYRNADGEFVLLFPNKFQTDNQIPAKQVVQVPPQGANFEIEMGPPFGRELLQAIVTERPLNDLELNELKGGNFGPVKLRNVKGAQAVLKKRRPNTWAEHHIEINLVPEGATRGLARRPRRVGLFIGVSVFQCPVIRKLITPCKDAKQLAETMQARCGLDEAYVLVDEDAALANIQKTFRERLIDATRAGDEVFIYWSGHGGRCADDFGDEADGFDEYLVPYDGQFDGNLDTIRRSMLMDDQIGRWIQDLDGRKVVVILDACHSGGQHNLEKGLGGLPGETKNGLLDFIDGEFARTKDIGQKDTALLASSKASEISLVRRKLDLSTMTYYLIERLKTGDKKLTLNDLHEYVKEKVAEYVKKEFQNITQTPVLVDQSSSPIVVRP